MSCTRKQFVREAKKYIGVNEFNGTHKFIIDEYNKIQPLPRGYQVQYTDPWCATFVSFIAKKCNALDIIEPECSCSIMIYQATKNGTWDENDNHKVKLGNIVLYDWNDNGKGDCVGLADHVGIVSQLTETSFTVIEGNKSGMVSTRTLGYNAQYIRGFICPRYSTSPANSPSPTSSNLDSIAHLVIRGDYGNGEQRVSQLTRLGYDAAAVQKRVNEILLGR